MSKHLGTNIFSENDENLAANYYIVLYGMNFLFRAPGTINSTAKDQSMVVVLPFLHGVDHEGAKPGMGVDTRRNRYYEY